MQSADLAFALLINRTAQFYETNPPTYMTYREYTHVTAPALGRAEDINRSIEVRNADDFAVMRDLPGGEERTGQAFPIIAYFDPFSWYGFGWFANLKRVDITLQRRSPITIAIPAPDQSVNDVIFYFSRLYVQYAPDSTDNALHLLISPTPRMQPGSYTSEVIEDAQTGLPSQITIRDTSDDEVITLSYKVLDGHWVIVHGNFSQTMHYAILTYKINADVTFSDIAFPTEAPDQRLAGTPPPSPSATSAPQTYARLR